MRAWPLPLLLAACASGAGAPPEEAPEPALGAEERLIRAGMALAGARPTLEELRAVGDDPAVLERAVDRWLETDAFGETVRDLHNDALLLRFDLLLLPQVGELAGAGLGGAELNRSIVEAPLRLIEHVVRTDRPYTEIVTADYALADRAVATVWGLDRPGGADGWQVATWRDGRPAAGILSHSSLWLRHASAGFNFHRERANAISRALLCFDFLSRDVSVDGGIDLSDPRAVSEAVVANPECASCHQTLDPLASYLGPIRAQVIPQLVTGYPIPMWNEAGADDWIEDTGRPPAYFGDQGGDLATLGRAIAADPRFAACAARRFFGWFAQLPPEDVPFEIVAELQRAFVESGYSAKALAKAAVLHPALARGPLAVPRKARPEQLARLAEDLAGFRWEVEIPFPIQDAPYGRVDLARSDLFGFRSVAGGIDSFYVTRPARTLNASSRLFLRSMALKIAGAAVERELAAPRASRRLLAEVEADERGEEAVRAQLAALHLLLLGERVGPSSVAVTESWSVFREVVSRTDDPARAWKVVLGAMLQDARVAYY